MAVLTIVCPVCSLDQITLHKRLHTFKTTQYANPAYSKLYHHCLRIRAGSSYDTLITIEWEPRHSGLRFLRIEFNPSTVSVAEVKAHIDLLLPGGYTALLASGGITRIDITGNLYHVDINMLMFWHGGLYKAKEWRGTSGNLETLYLGARETGTPKSASMTRPSSKRR